MKILVTGGAGYIGSITNSILLNEGFNLIVVDNLKNGFRENLPKGIEFLNGSILNTTFLKNVFQKFKPEAVIHLASFALVGESFKKPLDYFRNNVLGSYNLFNIASQFGVKNIIFASTSAVYGNTNSAPFKETDQITPINPYGQTKLIGEQLLQYFSRNSDMRFIIFRYFNVAGASLDNKVGENHHPETHIIPNIIKAAHHNQPFTIYGNDYPTPDGTCIRDYVHVVDLAQAHILAIKNLRKNRNLNEVFNVGSGIGYSNNEVVKMVEQKIGRKIRINYKKRRPGDPPRLIANISKITNKLGFKAKHSALTSIIQSSLSWYINHSRSNQS